MRQFQRVLAQLKTLVETHKPGDVLTPPPLLSHILVNEKKIYYAEMGPDHLSEKPAVILLHGFGGFFMDWPRVMAPISRHTRVFAIDLQGWGFSEMNPDAGTLDDEVHIVREFIRQLGLEKVVLAGLSYGAGVAWAAAANGLPRLQRVVLINPMPPNPLKFLKSPIYQGIFALNRSRTAALIGHKMMRKSQYKMICRENLLNERLLDSFYLDLAYLVMKQPKIPFLLNSFSKAAEKTDWLAWEHKLAGARVPVSILQGMQDRVFSFESASHLYDLIPHSELIEIDDCGHAMVFDQPRKVSDFLIAALDRVDEKRDSILHKPA
jgi:pimeloyl-ACP methyl ester carboxylesterase